jgi:hypothetical protein
MEEGTTILGRYIIAFVESTGDVSSVFKRKTRKIFEKNGLTVDDIEPDGQYDANKYADAMSEIRDEVGQKTLRQAGAEQAANVLWDEDINSVADGLRFVVQADREAHESPSGGFDGNYNFEMVDDSTARVGIPDYSPYPVDNFKGVFDGAVKSLSESGGARISDADPKPGEKTAFEVSW